MKNDSLGDRMKGYENVTRNKLMRRGYTIIRIDGKAFHSYTKGLIRPFDDGLIQDMNNTAIYLCKNIMGVKLGYVQSDEISLILTDFDNLNTEAWFDNNIQKMASVADSMATAKFNHLRTIRIIKNSTTSENDGLLTIHPHQKDIMEIKLAEFDARVFQVPNREEVINYLIWRQQDAIRNSISSVAQSLYSHKELYNVNTNQMQELIFQKGINWNNYKTREKRGGVIRKITEIIPMDIKSYDLMPNGNISVNGIGEKRTKWIEDINAPEIIKDRDFYYNIIPNN